MSKSTGEPVNTKDAQIKAKAKADEQTVANNTYNKKKSKGKPTQSVDDCLDDNIVWN